MAAEAAAKADGADKPKAGETGGAAQPQATDLKPKQMLLRPQMPKKPEPVQQHKPQPPAAAAAAARLTGQFAPEVEAGLLGKRKAPENGSAAEAVALATQVCSCFRRRVALAAAAAAAVLSRSLPPFHPSAAAAAEEEAGDSSRDSSSTAAEEAGDSIGAVHGPARRAPARQAAADGGGEEARGGRQSGAGCQVASKARGTLLDSRGGWAAFQSPSGSPSWR